MAKLQAMRQRLEERSASNITPPPPQAQQENQDAKRQRLQEQLRAKLARRTNPNSKS